jgi:nitrite reductase/ring-hydroxylating ferredoxin subunit/uncharacterized membrane protein
VDLYELVKRLEYAESIDAAAETARNAAGKLIRPGPLKDLLSGSWLGHPLHPALIPVPIGAWVSASVLDLAGGQNSRRAADRLVAFGILASLPAAAAGLADWSDTSGAQRRVGFVHALGNYAALGLMLGSYSARRRGRRGRGIVLALAADTLLMITAYLGGHLSYNQGVGTATTVFDRGPLEWTPVAAEADLREDEPTGVTAAGATLLLVRRSGRLRALAARCTHRGGPLHDGTLEDDCIVCPWHGSTFRLADGGIARGPATQPQPRYDTRIRNGKIEVRRAEGGTRRAGAV